MRRLVLLLVALTLASVPASALTIKEVIDLNRAGLGDDVLLALIEVDRSIFAIDHETIKSLKAAGLSERVIIAMIKSGRTEAPATSAVPAAPAVAQQPAPAPQVVVIEHDEPPVREVAVPYAVPVYIPVFQQTHRIRNRSHVSTLPVATPSIGLPAVPQYQNLPIHLQQHTVKPVEPVYWGFGGKLRPDAWTPSPVRGRRQDK